MLNGNTNFVLFFTTTFVFAVLTLVRWWDQRPWLDIRDVTVPNYSTFSSTLKQLRFVEQRVCRCDKH
ncbi:hypothetical protein NL676_020314 [Syzygium grande]|nr:hypothetical protein NL676_020314 [Syzygium grande]